MLAYGDGVDWTRLPLSRSSVPRAAERRTDPALIADVWQRPGTQVVLVAGGLLAVMPEAGDAVTLDLVAPSVLDGQSASLGSRHTGGSALTTADRTTEGTPDGALVAFLGNDGLDVLAVILPDPSPVPGDRTWRSLREVGYRLDDRQAGLASTAVALAAWHERHPRCPLCGAPTTPTLAGWTRTCVEDGSEHYPRTDPAVIMAVVDDADRLLLAHSTPWPGRRFSTLAGFVEPGESAEAAVAREVAEEVGVSVGEVFYRGSQSWPFPGSLMLAYRARATSTVITVDGAEIAEAHWFTREDLVAAVGAGEVVLPSQTSIARALIEEWLGGPIESESWESRG